METNLSIAQKNAIKRKKFLKTKDYLENFLITMWPMVGFILFGLIPLIMSVYMSFTFMSAPMLAEAEWIGFDNYVKILTNWDTKVIAAFKTTAILLLNVPFSLALGLYIAYLINKVSKGQNLLRSIFFIPYMCSMVVIALAFKLLYGFDSGVLNVMLQKLGFEKYGWLAGDTTAFMISVLIMSVWSNIGFCTVLFQAALSNVDKTYYEAAQVDGASSFVVFWKITFPAISPTLGYLVTIRLIGSMQIMTETQVLGTGMGSNGAAFPTWPGTTAGITDTVVYYIYNSITLWTYSYGYGYASAMSWVLAIIILIITRLNFALQRKWVSYDF